MIQKASATLQFEDAILVNISRSLGSGQCKYNGAIAVDDFHNLNQVAQIGSLGISGKVEANQLGFVKNLIDSVGDKVVPQATRPLPEEIAKKSGISVPQGSVVVGIGTANDSRSNVSSSSAAASSVLAVWNILLSILLVILKIIK